MGKKIKKSKTVSSSVCRVHKSKNFTLLSNSFLRSSNLSLASVGLLGRVMGLPEEWDYFQLYYYRLHRSQECHLPYRRRCWCMGYRKPFGRLW